MWKSCSVWWHLAQYALYDAFKTLTPWICFRTDEEEVTGLCGLHREYFSQTKKKKESKREMYPWYAEITVQVNVSAFYLTS